MKTSLYVFLGLLLLGACKPAGQEPDPDQSSGPPAITEVGKPTGPMATKTLGPAGGTLTSTDGKLTLTVPAGALSAQTALTLEPVENTAPNGVGQGYHFGPAGTRFAKPATWTYRYEPGEVNGRGPMAIAVQQPDRSWVLTQGAKLDPASRTITTQIRHFSWWSLVTQYELAPEADTMLLNSTKVFELQYINYKGGFPQFDAESNREDLLAPLGKVVAADPSVLKSVTLNGQKSGGDAGSVQVGPGTNGAQIVYTTPGEQPAKNPVALAVELRLPGSGQFVLVSNIFIKLPITFQVEGRDFKKLTSQAILGYVAASDKRTLSLTIREEDSPSASQHRLVVLVTNPTVGGFEFGEFVEANGLFPSQTHRQYGYKWKEPDGSVHYASGKIVITNIDRNKKLLEGSVSGTLVYHHQSARDSPRTHDITRFQATFSIPLLVYD